MIPKAVTLLLVAATAVSGRIAQGPGYHPHQMVLMPALSRGCPSALEPAPLICKFLQPEYHYKPQLIAPSTYIPPLVVEKCDHPEIDIEIPAIKKPIVIPEAPVLPPITIPKFPVPVIIEKTPAPIVEPCEPAFVPEMPVLPEIIAQPEPTFNEESVPEFPYQPLVVPQPPALPEFVMPELPVRVEMPMAEPCLDDQTPVAPFPEYIPPAPMPLPVVEPAFIQEAVVSNIPAAPELPPFEMPAMPEIVPEPFVPEIPHVWVVPQPESPAVEIPEPVRVELAIAEPCLEDMPFPAPMPAFPQEPVIMPEIPTAPVLPPFEMPVLPEIEVKPEPPVSYPIVPQVPEVPTFVIPELPVRVEVPMPEPCLEDQPIPVAPMPGYMPPPVPMPFPVEPFKPAVVVPEMPVPVLPPFKMSDLPKIVAKPEPSYVPAPMMPMIAPCPEDQLPIVSIPEYIRPLAPMPVPELPKVPLPEIPFALHQQMLMPMYQPDPCFGEVLPARLPKLPKPAKTMDPCEPLPVKMAEGYFVRVPSYIPSVHGDYYNHLPRMGAHMRYV